MNTQGKRVTTQIGFVGTGNMGGALVELLLENGYPVTVWNRSAEKTHKLKQAGAQVAASAREAVTHPEVVFSILGGDESIEQVFCAPDGAAGAMAAGAIHIGMSTISPQMGERLARIHASHGSTYIACPVFGRPEAARAGQLWLVAAGERTAFERIRPLLDKLGRGLTFLDETPAHAHLVKVAGNFLIASAIEAMSESFTLAERSGVKAERFLEVMNQVFRSPIYQNYGKLIADGPPETVGFALHWGLKDVKLVRATADAVSVPVPIADVLYQHLTASVARGRGDEDWLAVGEISRELAGLPARIK
jgi:3-hydroxyisobutyrate dehydrogenase-like beta-hydroxyacid dehydrogenase